ncbi:MAG: SagB/ThcOx family dehydrogenase [Patescibacteria group bacterium]
METKNKFYFLKLNKKIRSMVPSSDNNSTAKWPESWKRIYFKTYPRFPKLYLDKKIVTNNKTPLVDTILKRKSYDSKIDKVHNLTKEMLSTIFLSASIISEGKDIKYESKRSYPSGGGRYPLELYIIIFESKTIKKGLYHYNVKLHALEYMWSVNKKEVNKVFKQGYSTNSSGIVIINSVIDRSSIKYGERAYTFSHIEAGHIGQNIYLLSESIGLKCRPFGLFDNKKLLEILDIHNEEELIIYPIAIA